MLNLFVTVHPHLNLPYQGGGIQGDNEYSPPLAGGVRGGGELLHLFFKPSLIANDDLFSALFKEVIS